MEDRGAAVAGPETIVVRWTPWSVMAQAMEQVAAMAEAVAGAAVDVVVVVEAETRQRPRLWQCVIPLEGNVPMTTLFADPVPLSMVQLDAGLDGIRQSPRSKGNGVMIVRRPGTDRRAVLDVGELDLAQRLVGDNWKARGSRATPDRSAHPDAQLTLINARVNAHVGFRRSMITDFPPFCRQP